MPLRLHFHDTRNTGLANAFAGVEAGVDVLDASCGGLGGCPFAPDATGNIGTEDLVYMLERAGFETGYDLGPLIETAKWMSGLLGKPPAASVSRAGVFPRADARVRSCGPRTRHITGRATAVQTMIGDSSQASTALAEAVGALAEIAGQAHALVELHAQRAGVAGVAQMDHLGLGLEQHLAARLAHAPAEVDVLDVQEIALVEAARRRRSPRGACRSRRRRWSGRRHAVGRGVLLPVHLVAAPGRDAPGPGGSGDSRALIGVMSPRRAPRCSVRSAFSTRPPTRHGTGRPSMARDERRRRSRAAGRRRD